MKQRLTFTVLGNPRGKSRPRFSMHGTYKPKADVEYERRIQEACSKAMAEQGWEPDGEPFHISVLAVQEISKSTPKKTRKAIINGEIVKTIKPDADNILKIVLDACNELAWVDDKQGIEMSIYKMLGENPRIEVCIAKEAYHAEPQATP